MLGKGLDKKWFDLAELLLGEDRNKSHQKLSDFKSILYADPKLSKFMTPSFLESEAYLTIYLRAGTLGRCENHIFGPIKTLPWKCGVWCIYKR